MSDAPGGRRPARAVFFGSGSFGVPILDALVHARDVDVVGVVSVPDRRAGRGQELAPVPVATRARDLGLRLVQPTSLRTPEGIAAIVELEPEIGVLADFGRIVPAAVLDRVPRGILNVHPSLLPRHRGAAPVAAAILIGDTTAGVTIIRMDAGVDTGPIVASEAWSLRGDETAPQLEQHASRRGAALLARVLGPWLAGEIEAAPQDEASATLTRPFRREHGRLDPAASSVDLERRIRALQPWPGTWLDTIAGRVSVWSARARTVPAVDDEEIGTLTRQGLRTSDGYLELREVQPAGGRRMAYEAFVRGRPGLIGSRVITPEGVSTIRPLTDRVR